MQAGLHTLSVVFRHAQVIEGASLPAAGGINHGCTCVEQIEEFFRA
jgi:hypothetical protein